MKEYLVLVVPEMGCAYRWRDDYECLEWRPLSTNGSTNDDEWGAVEEELVGDEEVTFRGMNVMLHQVYRTVEKILKPKEV